MTSTPASTAFAINPVLLKALILDDDPVDRMRLKKICSQTGFSLEISEASTIDEMRDLLEEPYDFAFLDYHLGMETGLDALKVVLSQKEQIDVVPIMLTSVTDHSVAVEAMRRGCADYLVKEELSIDSLRKSIITSFERRMFYTAMADARDFRRKMQRAINLFNRSCGPEMREIISATLVRLNEFHRMGDDGNRLGEHAILLEQGCKDIVTLMDSLTAVVEESRKAETGTVKLVNGVH
ncbi:response regulator [Chachezhania sediminis]|uniref:response regulator n=1 Tax=Chachezhania sediminis TaxID=2599291 RepID=UPI00131CF01E|nr:response regulator [Chachezhania sediminis]